MYTPGCMVVTRLLLVVAAAYLVALSLYPALRLTRRRRWPAFVISAAGVALSPWLVPAGSGLWRFAAALVAVGFLVKVYDVGVQAGPVRGPTFRAYAAWLPNWFWLVWRKPPLAVRPGERGRDLRAIAASMALSVAAVVLCVVVFGWVDWSRRPFAVEHGVKVAAVVAAVIPLMNARAMAYGLVEGPVVYPAMRNPLAARTPADFWRRWNRPAGQFFREHGFEPAGGRRHPVRGTLAAFALSGVVHEYVFAAAGAPVRGWQVAFFLVQGVAAAATMRVRPKGWVALAWWAGTAAFMLAASALLFQSVDAVVPFYVAR